MSSFGIPVRNGLGVGLLASTSLATRNSSVFTPASLFAAGEQGVWYDPSDFSTMYQDSTGVTPVTAVGQSVGFLGDKSQGFALGPELGDGTLDNVSNWVVFGSNTIAQDGDGVAITFVNNAAGAYQFLRAASGLNTNLTVGKWYRVTGQAKVNSGSANVAVVNASTSTSAAITSTSFVDFSIYFLCDNATTNYIAAANLSAGEIITIRALSVRELPGNHATQSNVSLRPILGRVPFGGRRNLLTFTEQFDNAAWGKTNTTGSGLQLRETATTAEHYIDQIVSLSGDVTATFEVQEAGRNVIRLGLGTSSGTYGVVYTFSTNTISSVGTAIISSSATDLGDGYRRIVLTSNAGANRFRVQMTDGGVSSYLGDITKGVNVRKLQIEQGTTATAYQRVDTAFDVTQAGVPDCYYLSFDGTDDFLVTGNINFSATDEMTVIAGVRKLSDAAIAVVAELSAAAGASNPGSFSVRAPRSAAANYGVVNTGTIAIDPFASGYAAPTTNIIGLAGDISADATALRVNGAVAASSASDLGTGNYGNYPLYIGRRGGTAFPFNGQLYGLIVRGKTTAGAVLTNAENYMAGETGVYTLDQLNRFATLDASGVSYNAYGAADENSNNYLVPKTVLADDGTPYSVL